MLVFLGYNARISELAAQEQVEVAGVNIQHAGSLNHAMDRRAVINRGRPEDDAVVSVSQLATLFSV
ncbi:hypothetical protein HH1059_11490 [Halorhodospira halochloris]|uniref:Uncharacterized protein n=1 Tax=Halorhodospira halochloris TaxID=1052 RepID=A0A2Z6EZG9_HALHR|nr:hypothetical protein HH1059_11490 [Halorhodospira halochloris]